MQLLDIVKIKFRTVINGRGNEVIAVTETANSAVNKKLQPLKISLHAPEHGCLAFKVRGYLLLVQCFFALYVFARSAYRRYNGFA